jgi:hypothetical protein
MPAGSTYTPIATTSVSGQTSVTFSSIPQTYTDLVVVYSGKGSTTGEALFGGVGNGTIDTGANYSYTHLQGNGSTTNSNRATNNTLYVITNIVDAGTDANVILNFQNYSNTTTNKTIILRANSASTATAATVALWRSTAAINRIYINLSGGTFNAGSTFTLYGIAAA